MATYVQGQNGTPDAKTLARKAKTDSALTKAAQMSQQASARHAFGKACGLRDCKRLECIEALDDGLVSERRLPVGAPVPKPSRSHALQMRVSHTAQHHRGESRVNERLQMAQAVKIIFTIRVTTGATQEG
jgi:hypothetical protein